MSLMSDGPVETDAALEHALIADARRVRDHAYCPYSDFHVGAAVRTGSGRVYAGCNVENASYGLTMCAEQSAVAGAVSDGEREITAVAISADGTGPTWPCGRCRQVLAQFGPSMLVLCDVAGAPPAKARLDELLPKAFADSQFRAANDRDGSV